MKDQKDQKKKEFTWIKLPDTMQNKIYGGLHDECTVPYPYCRCNTHSYCLQHA